MEFGEKLKSLRLNKGMTQTEVAEYIGVTYQTCLSYEAGKSYPRRNGILLKLAELFECEPDDLFSEKRAFEARAEKNYGNKSSKHAHELKEELCELLSNSSLSDTCKDEIMQNLQESYWLGRKNSKKNNRGKAKKAVNS